MTWRSTFLLLCFWGVGFMPSYSQILRPTFTDSTCRISAIAFSDDEKTIAVAYSGRTGVWLIDHDSGRPLRYLHGHAKPIHFIAFDSFNGQLLTVSHDEVIQWRLTDFARHGRISLSLLPNPEQVIQAGQYEYDPSRQLLFLSAGDRLFCYSLRQNGLGKQLELKKKRQNVPVHSPVAIVAQAPDRKVLWALDISGELLRRIELENFRQEFQLEVPGAIDLAVDNERIAVLCETEEGWEVQLFDDQLQQLGRLPVDPDWLTGPVQGMQFTGKGMVSLVGPDGLVDIHLKTGAGCRRPIRETYDRLFFGAGGELFLLNGRRLSTIGPKGRLQKQTGLVISPWLLHDEVKGVTRLFDGSALRDVHGRLLASLPAVNTPPLCADLRSGVLAVAYAGGEIRLFRAGQESKPWRVLPVQETPGLIRVIPEQRRLLCLDGGGRTLRLLDWEDGQLLRQWSFEEAPLTALSVKDSLVWLGLGNGRLEQYEPASGNKHTSVVLRNDPLTAMTFSPAGEDLLLGGHSKIAVYKASALKLDHAVIGHDNALRQMHFNRSGDRFLSIAHDGSLKIWESASGHLLEHIELRGMAAIQAWFLEGGPDIAILTHSGTLLYRPGDLGIRSVDDFPAGKAGQSDDHYPQLAYNRDGTLLALHEPGCAWLEIWETASGTRLCRIPLPEDIPVNQLSFFDDRDILLLAGDCRFVYFDARSGQLLKAVDYCLAGLRLAGLLKKPDTPELWGVQQDGNQLFIFDSRSGDLLRSFPVQQPRSERQAAFHGMQFSFNGRHAALFDRQGVFIYDTQKEQFRTHLPLPRQANGTGGLSPDGSLLVFAADKYAEQIVYDLFQEKVLFQFKGASPVFLDNRFLAVAQTNRSAIDIWDCYRGAPVATIEAGRTGIRAMVAHAPSGRLLTSHGPGRLLFWQRSEELYDRPRSILVQPFPLQPYFRKPDVGRLLFEGVFPVEKTHYEPGI